MTREEAITVLKAFMKNPLFSDEHKQAFKIAIHDIKQRHDWEINNLILINRANIAEYGSIVVTYAITEDTKTDKGIEKLVSDVLKQAKEQMLEVIDKQGRK